MAPEMNNANSWTSEDARKWLKSEGHFPDSMLDFLCKEHNVDGRCLLLLHDTDFSMEPLSNLTLRDRKVLHMCVKNLQRENHTAMVQLGITDGCGSFYTQGYHQHSRCSNAGHTAPMHAYSEYCETITPPISEDGRSDKLQPEFFKAFLAMIYLFMVTWITAFVMVIVHDRVPDMKRYPPLPDIFLDNVPRIPWAFQLCEVTGTLLFTMWLLVLIFHKHRFVLLRRFFALSGTVFLLRCVTMLITSLSVPGAHLSCQPSNEPLLGDSYTVSELANKVARAYTIWRGAGMSIRGVRTCGDYLFSGHTVALTMLNFFITEYTPRDTSYLLHMMTWLMNMFGIFFILAAHEHYSIDVFVAFYITSRLFLYYHTLSNNKALIQNDLTRTRIWFPLFSYFESSTNGMVPNEFDTPSELIANIATGVLRICVKLRCLVKTTWALANAQMQDTLQAHLDSGVDKLVEGDHVEEKKKL